MNFMSDRPGFYDENLTLPPAPPSASRNISMSSSSSSSLHNISSLSHHHHQPFSVGGPGPLHPPDSSPTNNGGGGDDEDDHILLQRGSTSSAAVIEREHMFDKVVTPSDVGKLNRLVIPKQHAEKYFPLDSTTNEKGLLLNFEDRNGKPWRFRYSYWNSSQSYVMTKGWSRFVKEKKLDAGDIVSFQRGVGEAGKDRLFIDWRRRPDAPDLLPPSIPHHFSSFNRSNVHPWNPLFIQPGPAREYSHLMQHQLAPYHHQHHNTSHHHLTPYSPSYGYSTTVVNGNPCPPGSIVYLRSGPSGGGGGGSGILTRPRQEVGMVHMGTGGTSGGVEQMVFQSVPVVQGKAAAKRLRLFGVNMDCPISESDECDMLSNSTMPLHQYFPPTPNYSHQHHRYSTATTMTTTSSSSFGNSLQLRPYSDHDIVVNDEDKGKGSTSMSLDLDI